MSEEDLAQSFADSMYRYIDGAKIAVNAVFGMAGLGWTGTVTSTASAYINEKERSKASFARSHSDWSDEQKRNFNEAWIKRDANGPGGPHVPGSPKVFKGY